MVTNINAIINKFAEGLYEIPQANDNRKDNTVPSRYNEGIVFINDNKDIFNQE